MENKCITVFVSMFFRINTLFRFLFSFSSAVFSMMFLFTKKTLFETFHRSRRLLRLKTVYFQRISALLISLSHSMSDTSSSTSEEEKEGEEINTEQSEYEDDEKQHRFPSLLVDVVPDPRDVEEDILLPYFTKKINGLKPKKSQKPPEPKK